MMVLVIALMKCFELFTNVMDDLQESKLVRKRPESIRETFKVIEGRCRKRTMN